MYRSHFPFLDMLCWNRSNVIISMQNEFSPQFLQELRKVHDHMEYLQRMTIPTSTHPIDGANGLWGYFFASNGYLGGWTLVFLFGPLEGAQAISIKMYQILGYSIILCPMIKTLHVDITSPLLVYNLWVLHTFLLLNCLYFLIKKELCKSLTNNMHRTRNCQSRTTTYISWKIHVLVQASPLFFIILYEFLNAKEFFH